MVAKKTQPTRQRPRKVRGTAVFHEDDSLEFIPYAEGASTQKNVRTTRGAKLYDTTGEKSPLKVAYLTCPQDCADPYAEYLQQLDTLCSHLPSTTPRRLPERQRMLSEDGLECWLNQRQALLTFTGTISLSEHPLDWQAEVLRLMQLVVRRLPADDRFVRTLKKCLTQLNKARKDV